MQTYTETPSHYTLRCPATRLRSGSWEVRRRLSWGVPYGRISSTVDATITGNLGLGPGFSIGRSLTEAVTGIGDLIPMASLRWNFGVHNFMTYLTGNLTTGVYHSQSIANVGIGHNAIDWGGAYTYFDPKAGHEFSATLGFT